MNNTAALDAINQYSPNVFKISFVIGNAYTDNWFAVLFCLMIFIVSVWVMRSKAVETMRAFGTSAFVTLIVAVIIYQMGVLLQEHLIVMAVITAIIIFIQKTTDN